MRGRAQARSPTRGHGDPHTPAGVATPVPAGVPAPSSRRRFPAEMLAPAKAGHAASPLRHRRQPHQLGLNGLEMRAGARRRQVSRSSPECSPPRASRESRCANGRGRPVGTAALVSLVRSRLHHSTRPRPGRISPAGPAPDSPVGPTRRHCAGTAPPALPLQEAWRAGSPGPRRSRACAAIPAGSDARCPRRSP